MEDYVAFHGSWRFVGKFVTEATLFMALLFAVGTPLYLWLNNQPLGQMWSIIIELSGPILVAVATTAVFVVVMVRYRPIKVSPNGILATTTWWGKKGLVTWNDIQSVSCSYVYGFRTLALKRRDSSTAHIVSTLDKFDDLYSYVARHADPANVLAQWLRTAKPDA